MSFTFSHSYRQTRTLNRSMSQAFQMMRMNRAEILEHLSAEVARNPFLDADAPALWSPAHLRAPVAQDAAETVSDDRISLYRHISDHLPLLFDTGSQLDIAVAMLEEIEPSGWLGKPVEAIAAEHGYDLAACLHVLSRLQTIEPAGLFARDLRECLRLQAIDRGLLDGLMDRLITDLEEVIEFDVETLARRLQTDLHEVACCLKSIRQMNPKPGSVFSFDDTLLRDYDVLLTVSGEELAIELNKASFPTVKVQLSPADAGTSEMRQAPQLNELASAARSLKSAIEMRNSTTLAIVSAIFRRQRDFLSKGYASLLPMRMKDIAEDTGVSEATVSRILNGLKIQCSQGAVSAKSLFCSPVAYQGQPRTKHAAFQIIRSAVACEDRLHPLSDTELARLLKNQGLDVTRRTATKYRQSMGIAAPALRRKQAELSALVNRPQKEGIRHARR